MKHAELVLVVQGDPRKNVARQNNKIKNPGSLENFMEAPQEIRWLGAAGTYD
jgi:hypothetical protein